MDKIWDRKYFMSYSCWLVFVLAINVQMLFDA